MPVGMPGTRSPNGFSGGGGDVRGMWNEARPAAAGTAEAGTAEPGAARTQPGTPAGTPAGTQAGTPDDGLRQAADLLPAVTMPKGGGAICGLDEKFQVDTATGAARFELALPLGAGRSGFVPPLRLSYESSAGNGPLGFGWSLNIPAITRKTSKGLPCYRDGDESDVFILAGAEDLVPVLDQSGNFATSTRTADGDSYTVRRYRPRIEGLFARVERWTSIATGVSHWRTISRDNVTTLYGTGPASVVADPADPARIFSWSICASWDDKGNAASYSYLAEDSAGISQAVPHEANRTPLTRSAQAYLTSVSYGNTEPFFPAWTAPAAVPMPGPMPSRWLFRLVLDYGDHTASPPVPAADRPWPVRPDPFSSHRPGFEVRTYRRVQRLLFFSDFPDEPTAGSDYLAGSLDFSYSDQQAPADPGAPSYTFLVSLTQAGYRRDGQNSVTRAMPPLEFSYSQPQVQPQLSILDPDSMGNLPQGLNGQDFRLIDLDGEGLSGILSSDGASWYYKRNLSAGNLIARPDGTLAAQARFGPVETVTSVPSRAGTSGTRLLDLAGSGQLTVVSLADPDPGYFQRRDDGATFDPFQHFAALPVLDFTDPNLTFADLTGDGLADILLTEDGMFTVYASLGTTGFDSARLVRIPWDEEQGPKVVLADGTSTIFTADMTGDGLTDLVRIRNGEACYWPSTGYGRFGAKVTMDLAPRFDNEERFDPARIRLADIDGTGTADLLYIADDGVTSWFNQSGNSWSAPTRIGIFPTADELSSVQAADLLGTGTACLVWSSPLPSAATAPLRFVDLMGGTKPHLLTRVTNNLGGERRISYAPSTRYYVTDRTAGQPWVTRLPFPVQVVERVEAIDWIGRNRLVSRYAYHHGYFDGYEREFRGFGMVEQWDTEEFRADTEFDDGDFVNWDQQSWSPPMHTKTWFHTGVFRQAQEVSGQYAREYWIEPALRSSAQAASAAAMLLPGTVIPGGLSPLELQEAYRALKGHPVRTEVYADDGSARSADPYTVTEQNFTVRCLQPMGDNPHAVFFAFPRETVTFSYERDPADPRVSHQLTLDADDYGNPLRSVAVSYPRRGGYPPPEPALSATAQAMLAFDQARLHVTATERSYTNAIDDPVTWPDAYRVPLPSAADTAEITGIAPSVKGTGITSTFSYPEIDGPGGLWPIAWTATADIPYEQLPGADIDGAESAATAPARRFIARLRTCYRSDALDALLPAGQLQPLALTGESYQVALTPGLISAIFGALLPAATQSVTLTDAGYAELPGETGWWVPSGRIFYSPGAADSAAQELATARGQFFLPVRAVDPFGGVTTIGYDQYSLLPVSITDPVGNTTSASYDYRVLRPAVVTDPNNNRAMAAFDALGRVTATATAGTMEENLGDLLAGFTTDLDEAALLAQFADPLADPAAAIGSATERYLYDAAAYQRSAASPQPEPPAVYVLSRETHVSDLAAPPAFPGAPGTTRYQYRFSYSDGFGREVQHKALVTPGPVTSDGPQVSPRWVGSGWTILDNKGRAVLRYEPFFSATSGFEFAAQNGVATLTCYDPPGRVVATLYPDSSWTKTVIGPWSQQGWDRDDTVLIGDPRSDADVGRYFEQTLPAGPFTSWYAQRVGGGYGSTADERTAQQDAAQKAAAAAATPGAVHADSLGRTCLAVADNGPGNRYPIRTVLDPQGRPLAVFDSLGRRSQQYCYRATAGYVAGIDLAGRSLYQVSADSGARRTLPNAVGRPALGWDDRGHAFRFGYDAAQRLRQRYVADPGGQEALIELLVYGEGQPAANLRGRVFRHYDMAGYAENSQYDFKGNLVASARQLASGYHAAPDWTSLSGLTGPAQLDAAAAAAGLVPAGDGGRDLFSGSTMFDALSRPVQLVRPHNAAASVDVLQPGYDQGGRPLLVDVWLQQGAAPATLLDPATASRNAVTAITYNARGQRLSVTSGNGTATSYGYDPQTFRLASLTTTRPASVTAPLRTVQALTYFYDPVGNTTAIRDNADTQDVIFFRNARVEPSASFGYDPVYQLISATGREHLGQAGGALSPPQQVSNDDSARTGLLHPGDGLAMSTYTETYGYDAAGNLLTCTHQVSSGNWTRRYSYAEPSQITAAEVSDRLSASSLPGDPATGPFTGQYTYDAHGNMTTMPHLAALTWDEDDRLHSTARQPAAGGATAQTAWYCYAAGGQRVRKLTDRQATAAQQASRKAERIYLDGIEIYREYAADGATITMQRETLHVGDGVSSVALVETRTAGTDGGPAQQVRYQYPNQLGSAVLELDDSAQIVSYEEYFPYGSTSYQAVASQTDAPKRYRYTGKERDEENDLYYHGARYCAPWLGRWISCDPAGLADGPNRYAYVGGNPVGRSDPTGRQGEPPVGSSPPATPASGAQAGAGQPGAGQPGAGQPGAGQPAQAPRGQSMDDPPDIEPGPPHGSSDDDADSGDDDLKPVQLLTKGQGASDVGAGESLLEAMFSRAGGNSVTVYGRHTLKDYPHTTLGAQVAVDPADVRGGRADGTVTGVLHLAKLHDPGQWGDVSLYIEPYLKRDATGYSYGGAGVGTVSWDVTDALSLDIDATIAFDKLVLSSDSALTIGPAGMFGVGVDFTVKVRTHPGSRLYLYPEVGVGGQSGPQLAPPVPGGGAAGNKQYYAGIGAGTDYFGFLHAPFAGLYLGVQKQVWTPASGPETVSPPRTLVLNAEIAW